jgi:predicted heme/steroid binding protein
MKEFTKEELAKFNGKGGAPMYVAHQGKVYDVSSSSLWEGGEHQGMHVVGRI